ncbi:MAG: tripartite tricarboxylate transporter substrate binding protein [Deltaproteobacteria bacterium]
MKRVTIAFSTMLVLSILVSVSLAIAAEEKFPTRPITLINPLPPGGPTDIVLRLLAEKAGKALGQPVVPVNKPGGNFVIGISELQQAKPDGYTVGYLPSSGIFVLPHLEKVPYDTLKDFKPIIQYGAMNFGVIVQADSPYKTWKDLSAAGKTKKLRYGHSGPRTLQAIVLNLMAKNEGFSFINIPYKGSPESQTALIGGHLDVAAGDFSYSLVEAGKIRPIMMLADVRSPMYPNIQCLKDAGYDYPVPVPFIVAAPKDTPAPIMKALEDAFTKAVKDPEYVKGVTDIKLLTTYRSSAELASYMSATYQKVGEMLKQSGLKN